jgi:putative DNA primase/helicase
MIDSLILERARAYPIEHVATAHNLKLCGRIERIGPCPHCGGVDRFAINIKKQIFNCRGCGAGGNVIAFVQFLDGCDFRQAIETLIRGPIDGGQYKPKTGQPPSANDYETRQLEKARYLWRASQAPAGTPVETYLCYRLDGNTKPLPLTVRYLPALKPGHHPAMTVVYGLTKITAIQLTLLKPDGSGKAEVDPNKITIASPAGMPMVIAPPNDLLCLAICEGVEDALTVHYATGLGAWASGGAGFMPKLAAVVPNFIEAVTIYAHADDAGQRGAQELADALDVRGIEIRIEGIE